MSEHGKQGGMPWKNAKDLYETINSIKVGDIGWKMHKFKYNGPKPTSPPCWMEETYELNVQDILKVTKHQLSTSKFDRFFHTTPFEEFDHAGNCVMSDIMSASYPEQVWLSGIVSNWCPKCDALPTDLDGPRSHQCTHEKTDFLIKNFDPGILWDEFGVQNNIVPFTHGFL
ncbi:hypothetical protein H0H87_006543 [Tephrocybe sp. NHM501043]|nr:hypothetical protein H0H87_006543 [Tephrocybe sp. NHM501043]